MAIDTTTPDRSHRRCPHDRHRPTPPGCRTRDKLVLFVLCAAQFMVALDFSVLNVALPVLGADLGMSQSALQWAVTAFALPSGGFLLLFGRIGDLYGRRKLFLAGPRPLRRAPRCSRPSPGTRRRSSPGAPCRASARRRSCRPACPC